MRAVFSIVLPWFELKSKPRGFDQLNCKPIILIFLKLSFTVKFIPRQAIDVQLRAVEVNSDKLRDGLQFQ